MKQDDEFIMACLREGARDFVILPANTTPCRVDLPENCDLSFAPPDWFEILNTPEEIQLASHAGVLFRRSGSTPGCIKFDQGARRYFAVMTDEHLSEWAQEAECDSRVERSDEGADFNVSTVMWGIRKAV